MPNAWRVFPSVIAISPICRWEFGYPVKTDMPGLTGSAVETLYARGASWLKGDAASENVGRITP